MSLSWTQPICADCWDERNPDRPVRPEQKHNVSSLEMCSYCGKDTALGIYVRDDPANVAHPQPKEHLA